MIDHPKPNDLTPQEEWQWREAEFCDAMARSGKQDAQACLERSDHSSAHKDALHCAISAECWEQMARHFRQPIYIRIERQNQP